MGYAVVDIRWAAQNPTYIYNPDANLALDQNGRLFPRPIDSRARLPGKASNRLPTYLHGQGLKFGIILCGIPRIAYDTPAETLPNGYPIAGFVLHQGHPHR